MIEAKSKALVVAFVTVLAIAILISGCGKNYQCYEWEGNIMALRGTDTSFLFYIPEATFSHYVDSLKNQGYSIDTVNLWDVSIGGGKIRGNNNLRKFESVGDSCVEVI